MMTFEWGRIRRIVLIFRGLVLAGSFFQLSRLDFGTQKATGPILTLPVGR